MPNASDVPHFANRHAIPVATRVAKTGNRRSAVQLRNRCSVAQLCLPLILAAVIQSRKIGAMNAALDYTILEHCNTAVVSDLVATGLTAIASIQPNALQTVVDSSNGVAYFVAVVELPTIENINANSTAQPKFCWAFLLRGDRDTKADIVVAFIRKAGPGITELT